LKNHVPGLSILYETLGCTSKSLYPKKPGPQTKSSPFYTIVVGKIILIAVFWQGLWNPLG
jgi:hypothetical protein